VSSEQEYAYRIYTHKNRDLGDANEIRLYQKVLRLQTLVSLKRLKRLKFWESDSAGGNEFHTGVKNMYRALNLQFSL